ncbi:hypothetical protein BH18ACT1_BH18ACT1_09310 [soil metagenome]
MADDAELHARLRSHLDTTYGTAVAQLTRLQAWNPFVHRVDRRDGSSWVVRAFARERAFDRVAGDAGVLRHLEELGYPAERLAHESAVSMMGDRAVLVTEYLEGAEPDGSAHTQGALAGLLGRMATMPSDHGAPARAAGAWGGDPEHEGRPREDIVAALEILDEIEGRVPAAYEARSDSLRSQLLRGDDLDGLPEGLLHPDALPVNAIRRPDGSIVLIDWTSSGRGPRIAALGWMLDAGRAGGGMDSERTDAIAAGYAEHIRLEDDELRRLPDAMRIRSLYFACWYFRAAIAGGVPPNGRAMSACADERDTIGHAIATRVRELMRG